MNWSFLFWFFCFVFLRRADQSDISDGDFSSMQIPALPPPVKELSGSWLFPTTSSGFSSVVCFPFFPLCLVLCLTGSELFPGSQEKPVKTYTPSTEELLQQDAFHLKEDMQEPELHLSILETAEAWKASKNSLSSSGPDMTNPFTSLKFKFSLQMLRRVFHFTTTHNKPTYKSCPNTT